MCLPIVRPKFTAGLGALSGSGAIAARIAPDLRMACLLALSCFEAAAGQRPAQEVIGDACINLRQPTYGSICACNFEIDLQVEGN